MGIELSSFKAAIQENGKFLTVQGDNMTQVRPSEDDGLVLAQVQNPKGMSEMTKNAYVRGQLLENIRSSLVSAKLMSVGRNSANGNKEVRLFQSKTVEAFFEKAEKTLFGEVAKKGANKGQYGIETASQRLETQTAASLIEELNSLLPQVNIDDINNIVNINNINNINNIVNINNISNIDNVNNKEQSVSDESVATVKYKSGEETKTSEWTLYDTPNDQKTLRDEINTNCPFVTDEQEKFALSLDANLDFTDVYKANCQKLADCLGVNASQVGGIRLSGVEPAENGLDIVCTLTFANGTGGVRVLVGPDGELVSYSDYQELKKSLPGMADRFSASDLKEANRLVGFMKAVESTQGLYGKKYSKVFEAMLPVALAKARKENPTGPISLASWWKALGFAGKVPADDPTKSKSVKAFAAALEKRTEADFRTATGQEGDLSKSDTYSDLLEFDRYFSLLYTLKKNHLVENLVENGNLPTDEQVAAMLRLDSKQMSQVLGEDERGLLNPNVEEVKWSGDGKFLECTVKFSSGQTKTVLIGRDGKVISQALRAGLLQQFEEQALDGEGLLEGLDGADYPLMHQYLKFINAEIDAIGKEQNNNKLAAKDTRSFGAFKFGIVLKQGIISMLLSVVPALRMKNPGKTAKDLLPDIWKGLHLDGRPPESNDGEVGKKLLAAMQRRMADDLMECLGVAGEEVFRQYYAPRSKAEFEHATTKLGKLANDSENFGQILTRFVQPDGVDYFKKIELFKGKWLPRLGDLRSKQVKPSAPWTKNPEDLILNPKKGKNVNKYHVFYYPRTAGTKYMLGDELLYTVVSDTSDKTSDMAVERLKKEDYSPEQIYQLSEYLNNAGMMLPGSLGLPPEGHNCTVSVLPKNGKMKPGDMLVRARMPVVLCQGLGTLVPDKKNPNKKVMVKSRERAIYKITNQDFVHEFIIHKNGTMDMVNFKVEKDVKREPKFEDYDTKRQVKKNQG